MLRHLSITISVLLLTLCLCASANAEKCLKYGPTITLTGTLRSQAFPGPPNYESIKRGDLKETAIILTLTAPTCVTGEDPLGVSGPSETGVRKVQLVVLKTAHWRTIRRLKGKRAIVTGTLFHAHTGHHRTDVLVEVARIRRSNTWTRRKRSSSQHPFTRLRSGNWILNTGNWILKRGEHLKDSYRS